MLGAMVIDPWASVDPVWRPCFELAWESFQAGSIGVGAVLVDGAGAIVSAGRNRRNEHQAVPGQVGGSNIAHAEVNALAILPAAEYPDHVLYTTMEPCLLCAAALALSKIGTVRYAASDPLWGWVERVPEIIHRAPSQWTRRVGPLDGPLRVWAAVLPAMSFVERGQDRVVDSHGEVLPHVPALARKLLPEADKLRRMHLDQALETVWGELTS